MPARSPRPALASRRLRAAQHLLRRIAGHDLRAHRGQERRIDAGAAADLEHAEARLDPAREGRVRLQALMAGTCRPTPACRRSAPADRMRASPAAVAPRSNAIIRDRSRDIDFTGTGCSDARHRGRRRGWRDGRRRRPGDRRPAFPSPSASTRSARDRSSPLSARSRRRSASGRETKHRLGERVGARRIDRLGGVTGNLAERRGVRRQHRRCPTPSPRRRAGRSLHTTTERRRSRRGCRSPADPRTGRSR